MKNIFLKVNTHLYKNIISYRINGLHQYKHYQERIGHEKLPEEFSSILEDSCQAK